MVGCLVGVVVVVLLVVVVVCAWWWYDERMEENPKGALKAKPSAPVLRALCREPDDSMHPWSLPTCTWSPAMARWSLPTVAIVTPPSAVVVVADNSMAASVVVL